MLRHSIWIFLVTASIAPVLASYSSRAPDVSLACEQKEFNSTVESEECCRWLRAWHSWQECDQWGQDCATEDALTKIEKKLCSDQCVNLLDDISQVKNANQSSGTASGSALKPVCAHNEHPKQCPALQLGDTDMDDFPWVVIVLCVAISSFLSVFMFHRKCLPKYLEANSGPGTPTASKLGLHLTEHQIVNSLRSTATAAPDNSFSGGQMSMPNPTHAEQRASATEEEHACKESGMTVQQSLSLPPPPITLSVADQVESSNSSASATLSNTAAKPVLSLPPPPPALPPDPKIMKPVAPPPGLAVWHPPCPANGTAAEASDAKTNTEDDLPQHNPQSYNGPQKWPPALSCLWALRRVFICMAITGATCRALLLILRVWIPDVEAAPIAVELTLLVLQIFWVKRPSPPETGTELPTEVMHGGPGGILPRFGVFAVTTAVLELVSVAFSSQVSLSQACGFLPVALNILAAPVTVARCYSAFLALKLQDEADKLARRIAPEDLSSTPLDANLGDICIDLSESPAAAKHTSPTKLLKESSPEKKKLEKEPSKHCKSCLGNCSSRSRSSTEPKATKRPRTRVIVIAGSSIAVLSSIALALVLSLAEPEEEVKDLPSSCMTRQNGTTTCEFYEQLGSAIGGTDPLEACCRGCDELAGCQAWIYDSGSTRCRWIKFTDQPCVATPDKASCRCMTHPGAVFGYRPTRKVVMVTR